MMAQNVMMQNALAIASIFGPFLVVLGVWVLFYHGNMSKVMTAVKNNPGTLYVMGVINLLIGLSVLTSFNVWTWAPTLMITLFGWVMTVRGLMAFFMPQFFFNSKLLSDVSNLKVRGIILLIWGILMCWLAYGS